MNKFIHVLAVLGILFIVTVFTSFYAPPNVVIKEIEKLVYVNKYVPSSTFFVGKNVNTIISFFRTNYPDEYQKILAVYDTITHNHDVTVQIMEQSLDAGLPVNSMFGLAQRESSFKWWLDCTNPDGSHDRGLFQLNSTDRPDWKLADFFDIKKNTTSATKQMLYLLDRYSNSFNYSFAAWNTGTKRVDKHHIPFATAEHVIFVEQYEREFDVLFNGKVLPTLHHVSFEANDIKLKKE